MAQFTDLTSPSGLSSFDKHLLTRSYVDGFTPSQSDNSLLLRIHAAVDGKQYPNVARWLCHITSFCPSQRAKWSGKPLPAPVAAKGGKASAPAKKEEEEEEEDKGFSLSDDEDDEESNQMIAAMQAKKEAAKRLEKKDTNKMAKSTLILDVKPESSETDLGELEKQIRAIEMNGLLWGEFQRIPIAFGVEKIRAGSVIVDELVGVDDLQELIEQIDGVQSTDVHAFNKI